jgi:hypothetical protein
MSPYDFLRADPEPMPRWLAEFKPGDHFDLLTFFRSRVVYYPGAGTDGHPVKLFGSTGSAHSFVYVDYTIGQNEMEAELDHPKHHFMGYETLDRVTVVSEDFADVRMRDGRKGYVFLDVLTRKAEVGPEHGPERLAVLFIGADAYDAYQRLFHDASCVKPPYAILIQDHGFGGNYDTFGRYGLLANLAAQANTFPTYLLAPSQERNTRIWLGYERVPDLDGDRGGMHKTMRYLYRLVR